MKTAGYRGMIRDKCPKVVSHALKYCKAKNAWVEHVYKNWVWLYSSNEERLKACKTILGIKNGKLQFVFADTIAWDSLSKDEVIYWKRIQNWVSWFQKNYGYIKDSYCFSKSKDIDLVDIKRELMLNYFYEFCPTSKDSAEEKAKKSEFLNELVDFLIDCFENDF